MQQLLGDLDAPRAPRLFATFSEVSGSEEGIWKRRQTLLDTDSIRHRVISQVVGHNAHAGRGRVDTATWRPKTKVRRSLVAEESQDRYVEDDYSLVEPQGKKVKNL